MLDPQSGNKLLQGLKMELARKHFSLGTWTEDSFHSLIIIAQVDAYQQGMRDAFLKMGGYLKR